MYTLKYRRSFKNELRKLPKSVRFVVVRKVQRLAEKPRPRGVVKVRGKIDLYRLRQGQYRILYSIHDDVLIIIVINVAQRKDIYRRL
jgi:mRNA interferase RelE/StbE